MSKGTTRRWMKGGYEHEIRITVRCARNENHAKVLRLDAQLIHFNVAAIIAAILDGTRAAYITAPGPNSPIGKCAACGGELETTIEERHNDARYLDQNDQHLEHPRKSHA